MPNWCSNSITIEGPVAKIRELWEQTIQDADDETGLLNAMHPMPKELHDTDGMSDGPNWYSWRVDNWGTKWEVSSEGLEFTDNEDGTAEISGWFDSAWAPPVGAYERFVEQNEDCSLTASYFEPGMDFAGFWDNGSDEYCDNLHDEWKRGDAASDLYRRLDEEYDLSTQFADWAEDFADEEDLIEDE